MTRIRLRLVLLGGCEGSPERIEHSTLESLRSAFDVVVVENAEAVRQQLREGEPGAVLLGPAAAAALAPDDSQRIRLFDHIGEGAAIVEAGGRVLWSTAAFDALDEQTRQAFVDHCMRGMQLLEQSGPQPGSRIFAFASGDRHYELTVSPADVGGHEVRSAVGVLWDVTAAHSLQQKVDAIDAAGAELMRIEGASLRKLDMAHRLKLLEEKIVRSVRDLLNFDNFEIRLLDKQTNRLELVVAVGLSPLKIGEVIYAEPEGNGISGYVAATGESYVCPDVKGDPRYREGLDDAASSLTVPLRLYDSVIGVFNVESNTLDAFDDNDRQFTEIFGRYVAMAMHILDLMVVERYTTNEQVTANVLSELRAPMDELARRIDAMGQQADCTGPIRDELANVSRCASDIRERIEACTRGPKTILGAEQEMSRLDADPVLKDRRILVADNDHEIVDTLERMLQQKGCLVTVCYNGLDTISALEAAGDEQQFDVIISDIKMPDRTGYEIFRAARSIDPGIPVILMTGFGYDPHHSIIRASQEGLPPPLFKPFQASQLLDMLAKAICTG